MIHLLTITESLLHWNLVKNGVEFQCSYFEVEETTIICSCLWKLHVSCVVFMSLSRINVMENWIKETWINVSIVIFVSDNCTLEVFWTYAGSVEPALKMYRKQILQRRPNAGGVQRKMAGVEGLRRPLEIKAAGFEPAYTYTPAPATVRRRRWSGLCMYRLQSFKAGSYTAGLLPAYTLKLKKKEKKKEKLFIYIYIF